MAAVAKQIYRKGIDFRVVTTDAEATAAVAAGFKACEKVDVLVANKGATAARPRIGDVGPGFEYFDTTLNIPVYVKADSSGWVKADGTAG